MDRRGDRITELWAWIQVDPADDCEGIPALHAPHPVDGHLMAMPMIGSDRERMMSLKQYAHQFAKISGRPIQLRKFTVMEVVEEVKP